VSLGIVELRDAKASKREQKACWIFYQKTPTHYQWTTCVFLIFNIFHFPKRFLADSGYSQK
jgi:hypothetical protein